MKKALPLLLLVFCGAGNASSQTFNWSRQVGTNGDDWGYAVSVDNARNSYVTGSFEGAVAFPNSCGTLTSTSNTKDIFVAKFDPNGICLWAKQYGGGGVDEGLSISSDSLGNYVTGYFTGTVTFGSQSLVSQGPNDIFIARHDTNGTLSWAVRGGGPGSDVANGIANRKATLYATGYLSNPTASTVSFDSTSGAPCTLTSAYSSLDIFVVKYSTGGVCQVAKRAGGVNADTAYSISLDNLITGNVYVTGAFMGAATFGTITVNGSTLNPNVFIAKFDQALNVQWVQRVNGNARSHSISTDSQGNSYIAGQFLDTATFSPAFTLTSAGPGNVDAFIAKYDSAGGLMWAKGIGASVDAVAYGISVRETCDLFVTGSFQGTANFGGSTPLTSMVGGSDIFVARYNTYGVIQWALAAGGTLSEEGRGISVDSFGKASVTGTYRSSSVAFTGTSPNLTNTLGSTRNIFVAKASP